MTSVDIMEEVSKRFVELLANRAGCFHSKPERDYGVDLSIRKSNSRNGNRILTSGRTIDIQLKSVLAHNIREYESHINYDLEAKNYNDLIARKRENQFTPLILILFIFPTEESQWLQLTEETIILKKCGYWFQVSDSDTETTNSSTISISIPKQNIIDLNFFENLFTSNS